MMTDANEQNRDFVRALANGLEVLTAFGSISKTLTMAEIVACTGQSRPTARRAVLTLEILGYLRRSGHQLQLTPKVLEISGQAETVGLSYSGSNV